MKTFEMLERIYGAQMIESAGKKAETLESKELLKTSYDFVFKRVFGAESHKRVLVCLLNAILKGNPQIDSIELDNTEIPKESSDGKSVHLDIRAKTPEGLVVNIEIQCANRGELIHRSAF
jgi:predicted transposase/invertase (TIGR01784 family)